MRDKLRAGMPGLSSSLHPPPDLEPSLDYSLSTLDSASDSHSSLDSHASGSPSNTPWAWPAAQERLSTAYEQGGVVEWAETMVREMEAEDRDERRSRHAKVEGTQDEGV